MILTRHGNKRCIAGRIIPFFPPHSLYIEPFFGAGGIFFQKPKAQYNCVNDLDNEVYNLFYIVLPSPALFSELKQELKKLIIHESLLNYWKKHKEITPAKKALRFLFLSNFTYLGEGSVLRFGFNNDKENILNKLQATREKIEGVKFGNKDAVSFLKSISIKKKDKKRAFVYLDPPYLNTLGYNLNDKFTKDKAIELLNTVQGMGVKFAYSEFRTDFVYDQCQQRNLNLISIGERQNLKNRKEEVLITNYSFNYNLFE